MYWNGAGDYTTIQAGINAAVNGADTVEVAAGTYVENINFGGKNIILRSTDPTSDSVVTSTVIDGNSSGSVVTFSGAEDATCLLTGFTITNGSGTQIDPDFTGGGILGNGAMAP